MSGGASKVDITIAKLRLEQSLAHNKKFVLAGKVEQRIEHTAGKKFILNEKGLRLDTNT